MCASGLASFHMIFGYSVKLFRAGLAFPDLVDNAL